MYNISQIGQRKYSVVEAIVYKPASTTIKPLFSLDGVRSGEELVDNTGNGRNWDIQNRDFTVPGFPYKSESTISPPAGDAVLIAADKNNFLYDSGGTPNQIPVVSFYQNIDYEDIGFSRHLPQSVDGNGVEITQPTILDITWYPAALTGDNLITANSYFSVPTEQTTTVKWVSKDGNDTTGDGSKALPWLTLQKAQTDATLGDLIYSKTGEYTEASFLTVEKSMTGLGLIQFNGGGTSYDMLVNTANITLKNIILEGNTADTYGVLINSNKTGVTLERIYEKTHGRYLAFSLAANLMVKHCVGTSDTVYAVVRDQSGGVTVDTCVFSGDTAQCAKNITGSAGDVVVKNNKATGTISSFYDQSVAATSITILGNEFGSGVAIGYNTTGHAGTVEISYNTGTIGTRFINALAGGDIVVKNNDITMGGSSASIKIAERNCEVYNNIFIITTTGTPLVISAASGSYTVDSHNNYLENQTAGGMLNVGLESDLTPNTLSGPVYNNHCLGSFAYDGTTNATHGIFVWLNDDIDVYNNFIEGCALSIVLKGNGTDYSSGMCFANVCRNGRIVVKGIINSNIIGNTIHIDDDPGGAGLIYGINLLANGAFDSTGTIIKNNIITIDDATGYCIQADDANQTFTADYNIYYSTNPTPFKIGGTSYTFAEWQALGHDANSVMLTEAQFNALFTDAASNDFSLPVGSAAIGAGETLAATYDDGLDSSTDFGDGLTVPAIVTKQQTAPWDAGAYVS